VGAIQSNVVRLTGGLVFISTTVGMTLTNYAVSAQAREILLLAGGGFARNNYPPRQRHGRLFAGRSHTALLAKILWFFL